MNFTWRAIVTDAKGEIVEISNHETREDAEAHLREIHAVNPRLSVRAERIGRLIPFRRRTSAA